MTKLNLFRNTKINKPIAKHTAQPHEVNLITPMSEALPGEMVKLVAFDESISSDHRVHFIAYGLQPGTWVEIIQQSPVTIIHFDNTELALEKDLTRAILCQS